MQYHSCVGGFVQVARGEEDDRSYPVANAEQPKHGIQIERDNNLLPFFRSENIGDTDAAPLPPS